MKVYIIETPSEKGFNGVRYTISKGFPSSKVFYIDNLTRQTHHSLVKNIFAKIIDDEPIVLCDPDVIFYDNIENKLLGLGGKDSYLLCGNYIPNYWNSVVEANEVKRFHTSLLYFPAPKTLMEYLKSIPQRDNFPLDYFAPFIYGLNGVRFFYDTCANLYHLLAKERLFEFRPDILDCYSHISCGSILDYVVGKISGGQRLLKLHELAETDPDSLRYLWKEQYKFYRENPPKL